MEQASILRDQGTCCTVQDTSCLTQEVVRSIGTLEQQLARLKDDIEVFLAAAQAA